MNQQEEVILDPEEMFEAIAQGVIIGAIIADAIENASEEVPDPDLVGLLMLRQLLQGSQSGTGVPLTTNSSSSPPHQLLKACFRGDLEQVHRLADHPSVSIEGSPAFLHAAIKGGHINIVDFLLERGVDIDTSLENKCPLHLAFAENNFPVFERLVDSGANVSNLFQEVPDVLHRAAIRGQLDVIKLLVMNGGDVNSRGSHNHTPLHWAASRGHLEIVEFLIENDADLNARNERNATPLHLASNSPGSDIVTMVSIVELLIRSGAIVDCLDRDGTTPFLLACRYGNISILQSLLRGGANIKLTNEFHHTPLTSAIMGGQPLEVIQFLVENGADVWFTEDGFLTKLYSVLVIYSNMEALAYLVSSSPPPPKAKSYLTDFLALAISRQSVSLLKAVIAAGVNVNEGLPEQESSPINLAAAMSFFRDGSTKILEVLVDAGANVDELDKRGKSAIDYALASDFDCKDLDALEYLLKHSTITGQKSVELDRALQMSLLNRRFSLAKLLVKRGADLNATFEDSTVLQDCILAFKSFDIIQFLLQEGADPDGKPRDGEGVRLTPLEIACGSSDLAIIKALVDAGAKVNAIGEVGGLTPFLIACQMQNIQVLTFLIEAGADVFVTSDRKVSALHIAATFGRVEAIKLLLSRGLNINAVSECSGQAPLHFAAGSDVKNKVKEMLASPQGAELLKEFVDKRKTIPSSGSPSAVRLLVDEGADVNAVDEKGFTALHYSCSFGDLPTVQYLIEKGARVNDPSYTNETPLHMACMVGHVPLVKFLIEQGADLTAKNKRGDIPAATAALAGHWNTVIPILGIDDPVILPFQRAAARGEVSTEVLLESIDSLGVLGYSALQFAALNGKLNTVRYLLSLGASPTLKGTNESVLHSAISGKNLEVVEEIIEAILKSCEQNKDRFQAEMNTREDSAKETPLMTAVRTGRWVIVEALMEEWNVDPDLQNEDGLSALHIAVEDYLPDVVRVLRTAFLHRTNPSLQDKKGRTALDLAKELGNSEIIEILSENNPDSDSSLSSAEESDNSSVEDTLGNGTIDHNDNPISPNPIDKEPKLPSVIALPPPPPRSSLEIEPVKQEIRTLEPLSSNEIGPSGDGNQPVNPPEKTKSFSCFSFIFCCCSND